MLFHEIVIHMQALTDIVGFAQNTRIAFKVIIPVARAQKAE